MQRLNNLRKIIILLQILLQVMFPFLSTVSFISKAAATTIQPRLLPDLPYSALMSGTANTLASRNSASGVTNMATGAAASSAEEWLNHFGTAQVNLNVDNKGNWDNSSFDFLAPLYDNKKSILFTQLGLRAPDGRTTGNFGMGVRTFYTENWMFGANVFFDDDFTGKNRRVGFGAEAWTDYLKLSANTYVGTTEWHSSRDFDDYNEKPADGYDIRAEGYLPAWPQLGAKLMYEQYYGNKVALFDKDHLQNNPSAVTVGLNYTPVPMITAGIDYKRGQDSMDETVFNLNFRYAIGQSLQSQLSSDDVALRRSLAGSRYDLVDRNNEIILQYKKKDANPVVTDMTLTTPLDNSLADGLTTNTVALHAISSDGKSVANAAINWSVTGTAKLNSTTGVTDSNGNAIVNLTNTTSGPVTVTATSGAVTRTTVSSFSQSVAALNLVLTKNNSQADGADQNAGQVTLIDANGKVLPSVAITWQVGSGATVVSSNNTTDSNGQATINFSSATAGQIKLSALAGSKSESTTSTFVSPAVSAIDVTMTTDNSPADGSTANVAQALVKNAAGQPMANVSVTWTLGTGSATATTSLTVNTDASGIATLSLTDTVVEGVTVTAAAGGKSNQDVSTFTVDTSRKVARVIFSTSGKGNKSDPGIVEAIMVNSNGAPLSGINFIWSSPSNLGLNCIQVSPHPPNPTDTSGTASQPCDTTGTGINVPTSIRINGSLTLSGKDIFLTCTRNYVPATNSYVPDCILS